MDRLAQFEAMLTDIQAKYTDTAARMESLKAAGKEKSATFRQLMGDKLLYSSMLSLYRVYELTEE